MRAREPDALDARHLVHRLEQRREIARGIVRRLVVIHDLAEQLNLAVPLPAACITSLTMSRFGRMRSWPRV